MNLFLRICVDVLVPVLSSAVNHKKYMGVWIIVMLINIRKYIKNW